MLTSIAQYRLVSSHLQKITAATASKPDVKRETDYYLAHIGKIGTVDEFLKNDRLLRYALGAFGLRDMANAKAFVRKLLTEGNDKTSSFANKLADSRYREFVSAFNFARYGKAATVFDTAQQGTVDKYLRQAVEADAGSQNEGVRLALYFERKASSITNGYSILADAALLKVAQTALGLPAQTSAMSIDRQAALIAKKVDIADFKTPAKLQRFLERFLSNWDLANSQTITPLATLDTSGSTAVQIDVGSLAALQRLKIGGS